MELFRLLLKSEIIGEKHRENNHTFEAMKFCLKTSKSNHRQQSTVEKETKTQDKPETIETFR